MAIVICVIGQLFEAGKEEHSKDVPMSRYVKINVDVASILNKMASDPKSVFSTRALQCSRYVKKKIKIFYKL
jgi:predicted alternative tryptophan synthase beta-subunit